MELLDYIRMIEFAENRYFSHRGRGESVSREDFKFDALNSYNGECGLLPTLRDLSVGTFSQNG